MTQNVRVVVCGMICILLVVSLNKCNLENVNKPNQNKH